MKNSIFYPLLFAILVLPLKVAAQIASGPMLGYTEMTESLIWIQVEEPCSLKIEYWPEAHSDQKTSINQFIGNSTERVGKYVMSELEPGTTYEYSISVEDEIISFDYPLEFTTLELWQYRTDPPDFTMLTGSCHYANQPEMDRPGKPYGSESDIFNRMADLSPDMMLWLGDNVYLREPDWNTWSGFVHRYSHTRSEDRLQRFLATCPHYAIWDDHDFGPNDANGSFIHKDWSLDAFKLFWGNPSYGLPHLPSINTQFRFHDVEFFLLDNRYYRVDHQLETADAQILGDEQIDWLIQALKYSKASFKIIAIGGQVLNSAALYENYANYPEEREKLLSRLAAEELHNVIFLTGDRHHTELSRMERDGVVFHDLTVSPLTSGSYPNEEENLFRIDGTKYTNRNFAALNFSGKRKERTLEMVVYSEEGEPIWTRQINQQ